LIFMSISDESLLECNSFNRDTSFWYRLHWYDNVRLIKWASNKDRQLLLIDYGVGPSSVNADSFQEQHEWKSRRLCFCKDLSSLIFRYWCPHCRYVLVLINTAHGARIRRRTAKSCTCTGMSISFSLFMIFDKSLCRHSKHCLT
jgi:hypothetical protein